MSNAVFDRLPRFDGAANVATPIEEELEAAPPPEPVIDMSAVNAAAAALEAAVLQVEAGVRQQVTENVTAMAGQLFPALSERFLSAEIAQHLPELVPVSAPRIEICAPVELSERLEETIAARPGLSKRCDFSAANAPQDTRVLVSWETGGVTFDFDGLLTACLSRMDEMPNDRRI